MNPREAAKNPTDQGLYNQSLTDQLTRALNRISTLETQLAQSIQRQASVGNVAIFGEKADFGTGTSKVQFIGNSTRPPAGTPSGGVYLYVSEGRLIVIGSSGTITELSVA
jgi:hypothetical protein